MKTPKEIIYNWMKIHLMPPILEDDAEAIVKALEENGYVFKKRRK